MGDRVLIQVVNNRDEFGPIVYGHWSGSNVKEVLRSLKTRMKDRRGDIGYTTARLVQEMIGGDNGNLGFGVFNAERILSGVDSHGDAGVVVINCENFLACAAGGYYNEGEELSPLNYEE